MAGVPGRSGRRPDPDSAARMRGDDNYKWVRWVNLPPEGNLNPAPPMPDCPWYLGATADDGLHVQTKAEWSDRARELWQLLWKSPQSTQWSTELHPTVDRFLLTNELLWTADKGHNAYMAGMRAMENELGLTPRAMAAMFWRIKGDEETEATVTSLVAIEGGHSRGNRRNLDY